MAETLEERKKRHHQEDLQRLRGFIPVRNLFCWTLMVQIQWEKSTI